VENYAGTPEFRWFANVAHQKKVSAGCSKRPFSKAAASEEARRYKPHFVWPFTPIMDLGERISPARVSDLRKVLFKVEPLSDARTPLAGFFSILLGVG
jgi:hypothetical protein